jgi:hypothetical protein
LAVFRLVLKFTGRRIQTLTQTRAYPRGKPVRVPKPVLFTNYLRLKLLVNRQQEALLPAGDWQERFGRRDSSASSWSCELEANGSATVGEKFKIAGQVIILRHFVNRQQEALAVPSSAWSCEQRVYAMEVAAPIP